MSNKQTEEYLERLEEAQQDYDDALQALEYANKEFEDAYEWKKKMELQANKLASDLNKLRNKNI